jgi:hypothetical protein
MQSVFYSQKISASIDNIISDERQILVFTSDPARELMVYAPLQNDAGDIVSLSKTAEYDLPARTADAVCVGDKLYVALQSQITPLLVLGPKTL